MLCSAGHRLLRKCRSERKLREQHNNNHDRKDSVSSTTSSSDTLHQHHYRDDSHHSHHSHGGGGGGPYHHQDPEPDWDPLRLHPPMQHISVDRSPFYALTPGPRPVPIILRSHSSSTSGDGTPLDHWGRPIVSRPPTRRPPPPTATPSSMTTSSYPYSGPPTPLDATTATTATNQDNDAFELGLATKLSPPPHMILHAGVSSSSRSSSGSSSPPTSLNNHWGRRRRPSTSSSFSTCSSDGGLITAANGGSVVVHNSPRSRPRPAAAPPSVVDSPDYMIKHGAWKRRGIVFVSEQQAVGVAEEEDVFDVA